MASVNKTILLGNLGNDPEVRHLESGKSVATFSMATNESYKNKQGEKVTTTEWHNIVIWSPLAQVVEKYCKKGDALYVEGKLTHRSYESDGTTKYITEVVVRDMQLLGKKPSRPLPPEPGEAPSEEAKANIATDEPDDLPF